MISIFNDNHADYSFCSSFVSRSLATFTSDVGVEMLHGIAPLVMWFI